MNDADALLWGRSKKEISPRLLRRGSPERSGPSERNLPRLRSHSPTSWDGTISQHTGISRINSARADVNLAQALNPSAPRETQVRSPQGRAKTNQGFSNSLISSQNRPESSRAEFHPTTSKAFTPGNPESLGLSQAWNKDEKATGQWSKDTERYFQRHVHQDPGIPYPTWLENPRASIPPSNRRSVSPSGGMSIDPSNPTWSQIGQSSRASSPDIGSLNLDERPTRSPQQKEQNETPSPTNQSLFSPNFVHPVIRWGRAELMPQFRETKKRMDDLKRLAQNEPSSLRQPRRPPSGLEIEAKAANIRAKLALKDAHQAFQSGQYESQSTKLAFDVANDSTKLAVNLANSASKEHVRKRNYAISSRRFDDAARHERESSLTKIRSSLYWTYNDGLRGDYQNKLKNGKLKVFDNKEHSDRVAGVNTPDHILQYHLAHDLYQQARTVMSDSESEEEKLNLDYPKGFGSRERL